MTITGEHKSNLSPREARAWVRRWDRMQQAYIPARERRFQAMFDLLEVSAPTNLAALDLGCGTGALSARLLERFPRAKVVALDNDPVLLHLGRQSLGSQNGRLTWVKADLRRKYWTLQLSRRRFDAVLSTTALHWLTRSQLQEVYRALFPVIKDHGMFLNGDKAVSGMEGSRLSKLSHAAMERLQRQGLQSPGVDDWDGWWTAVRSVRSLEPFFAERDRMQWEHPTSGQHGDELTAEDHAEMLRFAGFAETAVVWREFENAILVGIR